MELLFWVFVGELELKENILRQLETSGKSNLLRNEEVVRFVWYVRSITKNFIACG